MMCRVLQIVGMLLLVLAAFLIFRGGERLREPTNRQEHARSRSRDLDPYLSLQNKLATRPTKSRESGSGRLSRLELGRGRVSSILKDIGFLIVETTDYEPKVDDFAFIARLGEEGGKDYLKVTAVDDRKCAMSIPDPAATDIQESDIVVFIETSQQ